MLMEIKLAPLVNLDTAKMEMVHVWLALQDVQHVAGSVLTATCHVLPASLDTVTPH